VPRAGTSATPATFTLSENVAAGFGVVCPFGVPGGGFVAIRILDSAGNPTVHFVGPVGLPVVGSLGASATIENALIGGTNNVLKVRITGHDDLNIENIIATAKISADAGAAEGAIRTTLVNEPPVAFPAATNQAPCVIPVAATVTASGKLAFAEAAGTTVHVVILDAGSCDFVAAAGTAGNAVFEGTNPENKAITAAPASAAGVQNVTTVALATPKSASDPVTQTGVPNCAPVPVFPFTIGSAGTVASALTETAATPLTVTVGENNQPVANVLLAEAPSGAPRSLTGTVTFTITAPGVLFSASPTVTPSSANIALNAGIPGANGVCTVSVDRKSCTVTVANTEPTGPVTGAESILLNNIRVDVDATATPGTGVNIVASQGTTGINIASSLVANIGRVIVGVAAQPTIFIGFNDQPSGMKTLTEAGTGFFQSGVGGNNTFGLCITTGETFTRAPWAVVTAAGGTPGLTLLNPATALAVSQIPGTLTNGGRCAYWTVFSASTTGPATIEIRGSADGTTPLPTGPNNGPRLSVGNGLAPGSEQAAILVGVNTNVVAGCTTFAGCQANPAFSSFVSEAIRAFKNSVTVTAASQPNCPPGTLDCLLGNIVITETQNGQFKANDIIRGYFLPDSKSLRNEVSIKAGNTNDLPIITTNTNSGLLVSAVTVVCPPNIPLLNICFFAFQVTQQSFGPAFGQVTVSNIHATIAKDATPGPIQMDWGNTGFILGVPIGAPIGQPFEATVSNGNIGTGPITATTKTSASTAVGKTNNSVLFTVGTKVVPLVASSNNIVTVRVKVDPALVGKSVVIERAVKNANGTWGAFTKITTRTIGADGYAYYYASAHSAQWVSYRGMFAGTTTGPIQYGTSRSQAVQVRWL